MRQLAAFFDLDGTLVDSNIVRYGVEIQTSEMTPARSALWKLRFLPRVPYYLTLDALDRERFQRAFYRLYRTSPQHLVEARAGELFERHIRPRLFPGGLARIADHRERGHRLVLVTGSIAPIAAPVARFLEVEDVLSSDLEVVDGVYTGEVEGRLLAGEAKAEAVRGFAAEHSIDLRRSYAYADGLDDIPMLSAVGRPAVVNPGRRLHAIARERGWGVYVWKADPEEPATEEGGS